MVEKANQKPQNVSHERKNERKIKEKKSLERTTKKKTE